MPWLGALSHTSRSSSSTNDQTISTVEVSTRLATFSGKHKRLLSSETTKAWLVAERMRVDLRDAVQQFTLAEGYDKQHIIYLSTEKFLKSLLKGYSELTLDQFDAKVKIDTSRAVLNFSDIYDEINISDSNDKIYENEISEIFTLLKENLFMQVKREGYLYLNTMKGILDKGRKYVLAAKAKTKEFENDRSPQMATPQGFQSISDVLDLFQVYQIEAKKLKDIRKNDPTFKSDKRDFSSKYKSSTTNTKQEVLIEPKSFSMYSMFTSCLYATIAFFLLLTSYGSNSVAGKSRTKPLKTPVVAETEENSDSKNKKLIDILYTFFIVRFQTATRNFHFFSNILSNGKFLIATSLKSLTERFIPTASPDISLDINMIEPSVTDTVIVPKKSLKSPTMLVKRSPKTGNPKVLGVSLVKQQKGEHQPLVDNKEDKIPAAPMISPVDFETDEFVEGGEWITCEATGNMKKGKAQTPRLVAAKKSTKQQPVSFAKKAVILSSKPIIPASGAVKARTGIVTNPPTESKVYSESNSQTQRSRATYAAVAKEADNQSDGSGMDGSTSEESDETIGSAERTRTPSFEHETLLGTSASSEEHQQGFAVNSATTKLRRLLAISTDVTSTEVSEPILMSTAFVDSNQPRMYAIHMIPGPDGMPMPMLLGADGLYYPVPSQGFPQMVTPGNFFSVPSPEQRRTDTVGRIRAQIEFYFSTPNLTRDKYLKSLMDSEGFVRIEQIMPFNRIKQLMADPYLVLDAVQTSNALDVVCEGPAEAARGDFAAIVLLPLQTVLATKIRSI